MSATGELSCQELVELVTDYFDDALPASERARFESHLRQCGGCTEYVEQMRLTVKLAGRLTEEALEPQAKNDLLKVFREWKAGN